MSRTGQSLFTIYWPEGPQLMNKVREASKKSTKKDGKSSSPFVVGFNPRGFTMCVVDVIEAESVAALSVQLELAKAYARESQNIPSGLRVLGRFSRGNRGNSPINTAEVPHDDGSREMRMKADIWVEMMPPTAGSNPMPDELFCCGVKVVRPQLHVVRFDPKLKYRTSPQYTSVIGRLGLGGVQSIVMGRPDMRMRLGPSPKSTIEGVVMPGHCCSLLTRRRNQTAGRSIIRPSISHDEITAGDRSDQRSIGANDSMAGSIDQLDSIDSNPSTANPTPQKERGHHKADSLDLDMDEATAASAKGLANLSIGGLTNGSIVGSNEAGEGYDDDDLTLEEIQGVPPRLNFETRCSRTELQATLNCISAGAIIREYFAKVKAGKQVRTAPSGDAKNTPRKADSPPGPPLVGILGPISTVALLICGLILSIIRPFTPFSYVVRLFEYRMLQWSNFWAVVGGKTNSCGLYPIFPIRLDEGCGRYQGLQCAAAFLCSSAADLLLGIFVAGLLEYFRHPFIAWIGGTAWFGLYELHCGYLDWFLGWPAGFKMNADLNQVLYHYSLAILDWWKALVTINSDWDWVGVSLRWCQLASVFGFSVSLSVVADCCNIATLHLRNTFHTFAILYRAFVAMLNTLLLEFRGKKVNPLRKREDMGDFSVDQILLATLVCTAMGFLFPTVAMYYFYFALVRTSVWLVQELLTALALASTAFPVYELLRWALFRNYIPQGIAITDVEVMTAKRRETVGQSPISSPTVPPQQSLPWVSMRLAVTPMPLSHAIVDFQAVVWTVFRAFTPGKILNFITHAKHKPAVNAKAWLFPHLVADCISPPVTINPRAHGLS